MAEPIDHDRIDQVSTRAPWLGVDNTAEAELEALKDSIAAGPGQNKRILHLERHITAGEAVCDCYEKKRTDMLGR